MLFHLLHRGVILWLQAEQLAKDFQALQQEHHRLAVTHDGEQQHSRLLQDDVTQLQVSHTYAIVMVHRPSSMLQIPWSVDENMSLDFADVQLCSGRRPWQGPSAHGPAVEW